VVADNEDRKFLFVNLNGAAIQLRRFDIYTGSFDVWPNQQTFTPIILASDTGQPFSMDKPWLVAGTRKPGKQEFYVSATDGSVGSFMDPPAVVYARSTDGGDTWFADLAKDVDDNQIYSRFATQISTVSGAQMDLPLFMLVTLSDDSGPGVYQYYQGDDATQGVVFSQLKQKVNGQELPLQLTSSKSRYSDLLPGAFEAMGPPVILADPASANRFYVIFMDECDSNHNPPGEACTAVGDVDVKCAAFERVAGTSRWQLTGTNRVNGIDTTNNPSRDEDQFLGGATMDSYGRIHVMYYDDRRYDQTDAAPPNNHKWDAYYAFSDDAGESFTEFLLSAPNDPNNSIPAMDNTLVQVAGNDELGEYQGIVAAPDPMALGGVVVWMAFTGSNPDALPGSSAKDVLVARATHSPAP